MQNAKHGEWVEIEEVLLQPDQRSPKVPEDTKKVPFIKYTKGFLQNERANIGDEVEIKTLIGRVKKGYLSEINPRYSHDFGKPILELIEAGNELREEVEEL